MFSIAYFDSVVRRGLLVWVEPLGSDGPQAIGGFTPEQLGFREESATLPQTVVTDDTQEDVLPGWVHPDEIIAARNERKRSLASV